MPGGVPDEPALDDWFDEPQPRAEGRAEMVREGDDWLDAGGATLGERRSALVVLGLGGRRLLLAAGVAAVLLLVIGLAAGGVFSGSSKSTQVETSTPTITSPAPTPTAPTSNGAADRPARTLKPGAKGAQVRALQRALTRLGYAPGKIDGSYGPATVKALTSFQRASKLTPDGILGPKTLAALTKALGQSG